MNTSLSTKTFEDKYVEAETVTEDSENSSLSNFTDAVSEVPNLNADSHDILLIEPFYGGSHKQLIDVLEQHIGKKFSVNKIALFYLPAKKWHWRARTSALHFSRVIPKSHDFKILFCSSVLNLAELIALRLDLAKLHKIVYFHENQLCYPIRKHKERDFQYGYNQILTSLVSDVVVFNSKYNMNSFLDNIDGFLKLQPDFRTKNLKNEILPKCRVIYFPIEVPLLSTAKENILHIVWPHRWEHDKNPQLFFEILFKLKNENLTFKVSILGESYEEVPDIFHSAKEILKEHIVHFGRLESKIEYYKVLKKSHVVVSTACHEFFGVAMLEAVLSGCFPLACNDLVYPEFYPSVCLYNTPNQLFKKLKNFCQKPWLAEEYLKKAQINTDRFNIETVIKDFLKLFWKDKVNPFVEGVSKIKDLIQELEESFRESSNVGNNLILRCVLLRAENQNLVHKIDEKKRQLSTHLLGKHWQFSIPSQEKYKLLDKSILEEKTKQIISTSQSKTTFPDILFNNKNEEIDILYKTIEDLQKKLRERDKKVEQICQKYLYLKTNKNKMENDLRSKILSLEKQLEITYDTLAQFQNEVQSAIEKDLSSTKNTYEALFLQEKLRCSKLMYEKIKLHHEIKRLEDNLRRQTIAPKGVNECWDVVKSVDKSTSEPLMRRF